MSAPISGQTGASQPAAEFTAADVEILRRDTLFQGFYRMDKLWLRHRRFDGGPAQEIARELFVRPSASGVILYDAPADRVLLIEQFRAGALASPHPWQIEVIAGLIGPGETPAGVAVRETEEEAGVVIAEADLEQVASFLTSAGGSDERFTLFAASADLSRAGGLHGLPGEGEDIRAATWALDDALALVASGRIDNAVCILALQWLTLNRDRLRRQWAR